MSVQDMPIEQYGLALAGAGSQANREVLLRNASVSDALLGRIDPSPKPRNPVEVLLEYLQRLQVEAEHFALRHHNMLEQLDLVRIDFEVTRERVAATVSAIALIDPDLVPIDWRNIGPSAKEPVIIPDKDIL